MAEVAALADQMPPRQPRLPNNVMLLVYIGSQWCTNNREAKHHLKVAQVQICDESGKIEKSIFCNLSVKIFTMLTFYSKLVLLSSNLKFQHIFMWKFSTCVIFAQGLK